MDAQRVDSGVGVDMERWRLLEFFGTGWRHVTRSDECVAKRIRVERIPVAVEIEVYEFAVERGIGCKTDDAVTLKDRALRIGEGDFVTNLEFAENGGVTTQGLDELGVGLAVVAFAQHRFGTVNAKRLGLLSIVRSYSC